MDFKNKTAIITGACSGMGLFTCQELAKQGANVVMLDINEEGLTKSCKALTDQNYSVVYRVVDVRSYEQIKAAVDFTKEKFGAIDITVSYAGGCGARVCNDPHSFNDLKIETIDWSVDVNFKSPLYMARAVLNYMIEQKSGVIINIGSIDGVTGSYASAYSASKSGLIGFTKSIALIGAPHNVRCCCVSPGPVLTREAMAKMRTPMGRAAEPIEVVNLVLYLCSEKAAFITGDNYLIDGGRACGAQNK